MPYATPQPVVANVLATAAIWSGAGDTAGALRLLNAHGLTVADMRSYLISKRGLLNGLGTVKPVIHRVPDPRLRFQPQLANLAGRGLGLGTLGFHFHNPFSAVTNAISAAAQKAKSAVSNQVMTAANIAVSLASGPPKSSAPAGSSGATYTDSSGNPISYFQYQQLMFQYNNPASAAPAAAPAAPIPPLASPTVAAQIQAATQPAPTVYPVSNQPASVNPANSAPLPSSSDGSTGDNSGGGDTGYQDAASVFNDMNGLGRFRHYPPRGARPLRPNPVVAGLRGLGYNFTQELQQAQSAMSSPGANQPASAPATAASSAPAAQPDISTQLNQISFDWPSGTLYVGTNKYSILTTLIGGLVVKTIMWGLSKGGNALKGAPALGGGAAAGKKGR
jgi:hypothetical protein